MDADDIAAGSDVGGRAGATGSCVRARKEGPIIMAKKPTRSWGMVMSLGIPLAIVGASAMAISYATLIDVARVNGLPLPELYPILVDVGTVGTMIAASQFRMRGLPGRWLAYTSFILLSCVSIVANATHAWSAADLTVTTPWAAAILAATPPATLLAITHLVMMLIPDEKERAKLQALRERADGTSTRPTPAPKPARKEAPIPKEAVTNLPVLVTVAPERVDLEHPQSETLASAPGLSLETSSEDTQPIQMVALPVDQSDAAVQELVLRHLLVEGKRPTGKQVGEWLGKTPKTGQRFLKKMEDEGLFNAHEHPSDKHLQQAPEVQLV